MRYRVLIEQDEDGVYVAEVPALPGCISQGKTQHLGFSLFVFLALNACPSILARNASKYKAIQRSRSSRVLAVVESLVAAA